MPNISGIYTALSGMNAQRRILDVTAHNIANQGTEGYHRQRVELSAIGIAAVPAVFAGVEAHVGGVDIDGVSRVTDQLAEDRFVEEQAAKGNTSTMRSTMDRIESAFPEPSEDGLAALLDEFWGGWSDLAARPGDAATRTQLLERADTLVEGLHNTVDAIAGVAEGAQQAIADLAEDVNDIARQISELNSAIIGSTNATNDLQDRRDLLVRDLAELVGADARPQANGQVDVYIGGRAIVSGPFIHEVDGASGVLRWKADTSEVLAPPSRAAALKETIDDVVPRYTALLDGVAERLVTEVNALHAAGYDRTGTTGLQFFDPTATTAATIRLSTDVAGQPDRIAAGAPVLPGPTAPGPLDGEQARAIAAIADSLTGPDDAYRSLVAGLGVETRTAQRRDGIQGQVLASAEADAMSVGGVNLDEEMANLVAAQRAFEASARVLNVVDSMLEVLLRTGVVGR